jgi:hypothetical protein
MRKDNNLVARTALGAAAGLLATWAMGRVTTWLYEREGEDARRREDRARGGRSSYENAAQKMAGLLGKELSDDQRTRFSSGLHWLLGATAGAAYGATRRKLPVLDVGRGLAFGTAFWALADEAAVPLLGLTPGPRAFPWQTHARGLAGHLAYGVVAHTALDAAERVLH